MKKIICLVIALALFTSLFACSDSTKSGGSSNTEESTTTDPYAGKSNLQMALEQQGDVNLEGMTFRILSLTRAVTFTIFPAQLKMKSSMRNLEANRFRTRFICATLRSLKNSGITIEPVWAGNTGDITAMVQQAVNAGDTDAFNVVLNRLDALVSNATNGLLLNYYNIDTMNLENKWVG